MSHTEHGSVLELEIWNNCHVVLMQIFDVKQKAVQLPPTLCPVQCLCFGRYLALRHTCADRVNTTNKMQVFRAGATPHSFVLGINKATKNPTPRCCVAGVRHMDTLRHGTLGRCRWHCLLYLLPTPSRPCSPQGPCEAKTETVHLQSDCEEHVP